jgi:hypothetical protein
MTSTAVPVPATTRRTSSRRAAAPADPRVLQNALPASASVVSTLSEDAIMAGPMQISSRPGSVAMFANPYREEREELLFVDVAGRLVWLTHDDSADGWQTVQLQVSSGVPATADEVVVAVHRDLGMWAFALDGGTTLRAWRLYEDADGAVGWGRRPDADVLAQAGARGLQVQYLPTRDVMAAVLWLRTDRARPARMAVDALFPRVTPDPAAADTGDADAPTVPTPPPGWSPVTVLEDLDPKLLAATSTIRYGVDGYGPNDPAHVYALDTNHTLWHTAGKWSTHSSRSVGVADGLAGTWGSSDGVGCVVVRHHNPIGHPELYTLTTVWPAAGSNVHAVDSYLDARLEDPVVWTDAEGRQHVYGVVDGTLRVVHQRGLGERHYVVHPVWDSHPLVVGTTSVDVAVTRPVVPSVDTWAVDPYPDDYPSQHVMHTEALPAAERCAVYTQDVTSSWWSREVVRLPATTVPYKATRFTTSVTLTAVTGAVVPGYPVSLSSDLPVDLEIGGRFYRCGPNHTVDVRTDNAGQVRIKVVARNLLGNQVHLTAAGLPDGTSFNPATVVHRFLAGTGTLAAYPKGVSDTVLRDAKKPDGSWLFPAWHQPPDPQHPLPSPQDVADWSRLAFAAQRELELRVPGGDGAPTTVRELLVQTWDPTRPAYEVVTAADRQGEVAASRTGHARYGGVWDGGSDDFGDLVEAIGNGVVDVVEVAFDYASRVGRLALKWLDDTLLWIEVTWEQSGENPIAFMTAVFNALEATVEDVLSTLQQLFDFGDVVKTRDALLQGLAQVPTATKPMWEQAKTYVHGWFAQQEAAVKAYFEDAKASAKGQTFGNLSVPPPDQVKPLADRLPPPSVLDPAKGLGPDTNWLMNKLLDNAEGDLAPAFEGGVPPEFLAVVTAMEDLFTVLEVDGGPAQAFLQAVEDLESLVTNLFDGLDPQELATLELVTLYDLVEQLITFGLKLADALILKIITVIEKVLECVPAILGMRFLDDTFLGYIWQFICDELGIDYSSPTVSDVFGTAMAYPVTVVSKAVLGHVPFPDGFPNLLATPAERAARVGVTGTPGPWFPDPDAHTGPEGYAVPPGDQLAVQMVVAVSQLAFVLVDLYMDSTAFSDDLDMMPSTAKDKCFIAFLTIFDMLAFGIGDMAVFWGVPEFWTATSDTGETDKLWWGEYICKMFVYTGDLAVAAIWPFVDTTKFTNWGETLATAQGSKGQAWITLFGLGEWACSLALWGIAWRDGAKAIDHVWFVSQTLSMASSVTAFMRLPVVYEDRPPVQMAKYLIDGVGDIGAGIWYIAMAGEQIYEGAPKFSAIDWPKAPVQVGDTFRGTLEDAGCTFGPPGWRFDDVESLPRGESRFVAMPPDGANNLVGVEITPAVPGSFQIQVRETNGYDPNLSTVKSFPLTVEPRLAFRGASTAQWAGFEGSVPITLPDSYRAGDLILLFATVVDGSFPQPLPTNDWSLLGFDQGNPATFVYRSVGSGFVAGQQVFVDFGGLVTLEADLVLAVWSGVDPATPVQAFAFAHDDERRTQRTTPAVDVANATSWVVSFWVDWGPDERTTSWTLPASVTQRTQTAAVLTQFSSVLADSGGFVPTGRTDPLTAVSDQPSTGASMWSLVLPMAL